MNIWNVRCTVASWSVIRTWTWFPEIPELGDTVILESGQGETITSVEFVGYAWVFLKVFMVTSTRKPEDIDLRVAA